MNERSKEWILEDIREISKLIQETLELSQIMKGQLAFSDNEAWHFVFKLSDRVSRVGVVIYDAIKLLDQYLIFYCEGLDLEEQVIILEEGAQCDLRILYDEVITALEHFCSILKLCNFQTNFNQCRQKAIGIGELKNKLEKLVLMENYAMAQDNRCRFFKSAQLYLQAILRDLEFLEDAITLVLVKCTPLSRPKYSQS